MTAPPLALDDIDNQILGSDVRINLGALNQNFITASVAVAVESFSFVFVAYTDRNGDSFTIGVSYMHDCYRTVLFNYSYSNSV